VDHGKAALRSLARVPALHPVVRRLYDWKMRRHPANRPHPFDREHGIRTGGEWPRFLLAGDWRGRDHITGYLGCVPSVVRAALAKLPDVSAFAFVDLGCGKGRALAVASEFPFRRILGLEIDRRLIRIARRNMAVVASRHPARPPIEVLHADASAPELPPGDVVLFLYHPFDATLVERLADRLERDPVPGRRLFVVYANPVHGALFDGRAAFSRWYAETLSCAAEEAALGGAPTETIAVWCKGAKGAPSPHRTGGRLVVNAWGDRADIV
jgi:SAM-dependent methyltransferase